MGERATFSFMVGGDRMSFSPKILDMCDIKRLTIVYGDGSLAIMVRQPDGTFSYERRER